MKRFGMLLLNINWLTRLIFLVSASVLLFAYLLWRGINDFSFFTSNQLDNLHILISLLSIAHAWILALFYRQANRIIPFPSVKLTMNRSHIIAHFVFLGAAAVFLGVCMFNIIDVSPISYIQALSSYLLSTIAMILIFVAAVKYNSKKIVHDICYSFFAFIQLYLIFALLLQEKLIIFKLMINWYPFGHFLLNF